MMIIVDVNIILSALIADATTRELIVTSNHHLCFPEPSLEKINKYKQLILEKSELSELEFLVVLNTLFNFIQIIPLKVIEERWEEAKNVMEHIYPEDVTIIAAALSRENAIIWSDDKHFNKQEKILSITTRDMITLLSFQ